MTYTINRLTHCYRKLHPNQLWQKHREERAFSPDDELVARRARNVAYVMLRCAVELVNTLSALVASSSVTIQQNTVLLNQAVSFLDQQRKATQYMRHGYPLLASELLANSQQVSAAISILFQANTSTYMRARDCILMQLEKCIRLSEMMLRVDSALMDIAPYQPAGKYCTDRKHVRLQDWENSIHGEQSSMEDFRYKPTEIRAILEKLQLGENCEVRRTASARTYKFNTEELLLYTFFRVAHGTPHNEMAKKHHGGDSSMWVAGYHSLIRHVLELYGHNLNIRPGLERYTYEQFQEFARVIEEQANRERDYKNKPGHVVRVFEGARIPVGTNNVVGFVDCSNDPVCRWGSGPCGQKGSDRKPQWREKQGSIYTRKGKLHAIKPLALITPDGIAHLFGPVSARRNENLVLDWSQADDYLYFYIFTPARGFPVIFVFYGDQAFIGARHCFATRHVPLIAGQALPLQLLRINHGMKIVREAHEHYYGLMKDLWWLAMERRLQSLGLNPQYVIDEVRFMYLLTNIYTCFRGNNVSSQFGLRHPSFDDYLRL